MDKRAFIHFMRENKKSDRTIARYVKYLEVFKRYLLEKKRGKHLEEVTPGDVKNFAFWGDKELKGITQHLWAIKVYAEYMSRHDLEMTANELMGERYASQFKIKDFKGVASEHVKALALIGIKTAAQMIVAGRTKKKRQKLSKKTNLSIDSITELVKLSDLARIPGLKKVRARLYYKAGLDTVEKIAEWNSEEMRRMLCEFVKRTGFKGIAPLPKEAASTIAMAKHLSKIVEY